MAPGITTDADQFSQYGNSLQAKTVHREPLQLSGALDKFASEDITPVIGREFPSLSIVEDILNADNADELIRDLAITSTHQS